MPDRIFIGDANGYLYAISLTNPAKRTAATLSIGWTADPNFGDTGFGIVDPPMVATDNANPTIDQVFAFTGCSSVYLIGGAINQAPANFTSTTTFTTVDLGSASGNGDCTGLNVHAADFDNAFWTNGSTNGHIMACGFVSGTPTAPLKPSNPKMYMYPFTGRAIE